MTEILYLLAQYCVQQGWTPVGWRVFTVGPLEITVNGTQARRDHLDPYYARIMHRDVVAIMIISPFAGGVGGWVGAEDALIADLKAALV